jgi:hypothetical protein
VSSFFSEWTVLVDHSTHFYYICICFNLKFRGRGTLLHFCETIVTRKRIYSETTRVLRKQKAKETIEYSLLWVGIPFSPLTLLLWMKDFVLLCEERGFSIEKSYKSVSCQSLSSSLMMKHVTCTYGFGWRWCSLFMTHFRLLFLGLSNHVQTWADFASTGTRRWGLLVDDHTADSGKWVSFHTEMIWRDREQHET